MRLIVLTTLLLGSTASAAQLTVFAAASLTDAFTELGQQFDARTGNKTVFQFAGSQALRTQLENGARADVYASANNAQFDPLVKAGLVVAGQPFVSNKLAVIVPSNSRKVSTLRDLTAPGVRIVIADKAVPVGDYTRRMLGAIDQAGTYGKDFSARFMKNVVSEEPNVRQVALKVGLGEADAAVVYRSDVTPALKNDVRVVALPTRFNQTARYPIGTLKASRNAAAAQAFIAYVRSIEGQKILRKWGFQSPR
ncbi:molybdate ABC transporter substrate-binding protein [Deinococcus radiodurans]|jgi:molybdenum ABC transporter, periplasmic molybdate-binding protein|uniref:Molybdenum ABC transporter, periplasmic molybdate-binding protein, putative n=1 Tax=Deinococcus radiodurans (strain ATCC 13939 / DSM 20539 / JCM 16871 / CCUG 27074 / LMG 4051 / NBRC 15346 / NCIMB 9279 / VKM B-1422 / R1) TaxID=243230 RepID=Q9RYY4_DEIRA|nr:molybdate ABC transporter substrate-binding protein [Deinococcus radiodurans]AAF12200.1 molybdenum ABC transporter, periplasmic molybdate-binding protein, putative [Deinococcus radiodurans R1 = ATCC 13939 = DSM 20539]ANC73021.1 molybdenum ABC transporter substrate-binding protein [Deinococcus radiodurans R1 = ATCC 13939 = DSM 20539]QEM72977.1 molybdate ABC transporter substrate-binding protein [Deinococcus radiodurans]QIP30339.1 molybdate ABC transporter substrate-binding protein [Deinococcu